MESGKKTVTVLVRVWGNDGWQSYNTRVIPDEDGQVSMEDIWLTLKETKNVPLTTTKGFRFSYHHFAVCRWANLVLPWDARVDPSTTPTLYLTRYDGDAEDSGNEDDAKDAKGEGGHSKRPDLKQTVRVKVLENKLWRTYYVDVILDEAGRVSTEDIFATLKETLPHLVTKGFRFYHDHEFLPWDACVTPTGETTLYLIRYDSSKAAASGSDNVKEGGGQQTKPDLQALCRETEKEEAEEARTKERMKELVDKDWNRDFGHCFPNLYEGLAEDIADLRAKRRRLEEEEEEEGS